MSIYFLRFMWQIKSPFGGYNYCPSIREHFKQQSIISRRIFGLGKDCKNPKWMLLNKTGCLQCVIYLSTLVDNTTIKKKLSHGNRVLSYSYA